MMKFSIVIVILVAAFFFMKNVAVPDMQQPKSAPMNVLASPVTDENQVDVENVLPVTLEIPSLDIRADIEHVGMEEKGNMDIPKDDFHVAWFEPGYLPGSTGNAVIAGHLDTKTGKPAIFYRLEKLKRGDLIQIRNRDNSLISFTVTGRETYSADSFPLVKVFGPGEKAGLNLITCEGVYDATKGGYSDRTVVFSERVE